MSSSTGGATTGGRGGGTAGRGGGGGPSDPPRSDEPQSRGAQERSQRRIQDLRQREADVRADMQRNLNNQGAILATQIGLMEDSSDASDAGRLILRRIRADFVDAMNEAIRFGVDVTEPADMFLQLETANPWLMEPLQANEGNESDRRARAIRNNRDLFVQLRTQLEGILAEMMDDEFADEPIRAGGNSQGRGNDRGGGHNQGGANSQGGGHDDDNGQQGRGGEQQEGNAPDKGQSPEPNQPEGPERERERNHGQGVRDAVTQLRNEYDAFLNTEYGDAENRLDDAMGLLGDMGRLINPILRVLEVATQEREELDAAIRERDNARIARTAAFGLAQPRQQEIKDLNKRISELQVERDRFAEQVATAKAERDAAIPSVPQTGPLLRRLDQQLDVMRRNLDVATADRERMRAQMQEQIDALQRRVTTAEFNERDVNLRLAQRGEDMTSLRNYNTQLREQVGRLQNEQEINLASLSQRSEEVDERDRRIRTQEQVIEERNRDNRELENSLRRRTTERNNLRNEVVRLGGHRFRNGTVQGEDGWPNGIPRNHRPPNELPRGGDRSSPPGPSGRLGGGGSSSPGQGGGTGSNGPPDNGSLQNEDGGGGRESVFTQVSRAIDFLRRQRRPEMLQAILEYLNMANANESESKRIARALQTHQRVQFIRDPQSEAWDSGTYVYLPFEGIRNREELLAYLEMNPTVTILIKDLKDSWPDCERGIDELEREGKILVGRSKREKLARTVRANVGPPGEEHTPRPPLVPGERLVSDIIEREPGPPVAPDASPPIKPRDAWQGDHGSRPQEPIVQGSNTDAPVRPRPGGPTVVQPGIGGSSATVQGERAETQVMYAIAFLRDTGEPQTIQAIAAHLNLPDSAIARRICISTLLRRHHQVQFTRDEEDNTWDYGTYTYRPGDNDRHQPWIQQPGGHNEGNIQGPGESAHTQIPYAVQYLRDIGGARPIHEILAHLNLTNATDERQGGIRNLLQYHPRVRFIADFLRYPKAWDSGTYTYRPSEEEEGLEGQNQGDVQEPEDQPRSQPRDQTGNQPGNQPGNPPGGDQPGGDQPGKVPEKDPKERSEKGPKKGTKKADKDPPYRPDAPVTPVKGNASTQETETPNTPERRPIRTTRNATPNYGRTTTKRKPSKKRKSQDSGEPGDIPTKKNKKSPKGNKINSPTRKKEDGDKPQDG